MQRRGDCSLPPLASLVRAPCAARVGLHASHARQLSGHGGKGPLRYAATPLCGGRLKWKAAESTCPSRNWYRDSGNWRIHISTRADGFCLMDKRDWSVVLVGSKDQCKAEAERRNG